MKRLILGLGLFFLGVSGVNAQQAERPSFKLEVLKEASPKFDPEALMEKPSEAYQDVALSYTDQGFTDQSYWVKLKLTNSDSSDFKGFMQFGRPITDSTLVFSGDRLMQSGDQIPFAKKAIAHRQNVFPIELSANSEQTLYIYAKSDGETLDLKPQFYSQAEFNQREYHQQLILGVFYGMLFISSLIYLFFYKGLRELSFLSYGLYVLSIALLQGSLDGFTFQYLFSNPSGIGNKMVLLSAAFSNFFLLKYGEQFLKVKQLLPKTFRFYQLFYILIPVVALSIFLGDRALALAYLVSNVNGLLSLILLLSSISYIHFKIQKVDLFFRIGMFFLVFGLLAFVMNNLGLLPNYFWIQNLAKAGIALEIVFLSLSMMNLIGKLREMKEASQAEALRKSEEISSMKTYFMSNISHELRTPINAILGISSVALEGDLKEEDYDNYQIIRRAAVGLISNVNDILDFEQIEKGKLKLNLESSFELKKVIEDLGNSWAYEAERKGLTFHFEYESDELPTIKADGKRLHQIINNLLSNALKFTHSGGIMFTVKTKTLSNHVALDLSIQDTGIGMEKEQLSNIFESFNQMKLNNKRRYGGLGLGLTIVKHLSDLFGAKLNIESEKDQGTKVNLTLDLATQESAKKEPEAQETFAAVPNTQFKQMSAKDYTLSTDIRVLYAEDNKMNQLIMQKMLSNVSQVSLEIVEDGQLALEALGSNSYDVVLMDLQMPNMDGYEACMHIRTGAVGEVYREIPIIAVTADATLETEKRVMDLGMNAYLTKPVMKEDLVNHILKHAGSRRIAS